jgi:hypothetical protein
MVKTPTDKQIRLVGDITRVLEIDFPQTSKDFTRQRYSDFINKHIWDYKMVAVYDNYDEEDLMYFAQNDVWCEHY